MSQIYLRELVLQAFVNLVRRPKRVGALAGACALVFVLAGCSPGEVETLFTGTSDTGVALDVGFFMTCKAAASTAKGNCTGWGKASVAGAPFYTTTGTGGTGNLNIFPPSNCTASPCSQNAGVDIMGTGVFAGRAVNYEFVGYDRDPSLSDSGTLTIAGTSYNFTCNNCVEVTMQPGTTPNPST